jgi:hypothetical protein
LNPEALLWGWEQFCAEKTGQIMPINYIDVGENALVVGHEVDMDAPPITCVGGRIVRRLACIFPYEQEEVTWH